MKMKLKILVFLALAQLIMLSAAAQEKAQDVNPSADKKGWFIGVQGGVPFGVSTFSSFGAYKTHTGYSAGLYGGYRFNPVLSLEATAKMGQLNLSPQECCANQTFWLGADGIQYNAPVLNMDGWDYANLKSSVFMQHYGLQLNVNILGFFNKTKYSRWSIEVSPLLAAVGTKATVKSISNGAEALKGNARWHLGAGGNLQAGYRVTKHLNIGIYSGITYLTGKHIDAMPESKHKANYVWESGIKIGFRLGKCRKGSSSSAPVAASPIVETPISKPEKPASPEETAPATEVKEEVVEKVETTPAAVTPVELPIIYFAFDSKTIAASELEKMQQIKREMEANLQMKITVNGWCDKYGSKAVNERISLQRAQTVRGWLVNNGIAENRITVKGNGSDFSKAPADARRVESIIECKEE